MRPASKLTSLRTGLGALVVVGVVLVLGLPAAGGSPSDPSGPSVPTLPGSPSTTEDRTSTTEDRTTTTEDTGGSDPSGSTDGEADPEEDGAGADEGADDGGDGVSGVVVALLVLGAFVLGLLVAAVPLILSRRRPSGASGTPAAFSPPAAPPVLSAAPAPAQPTEAPAPAPAPAGAAGPVIGAAPSREEALIQNQRVGLAAALINLRDQMPSNALAEEAQRALAAAGITEIRPDGETFDPARHRAADQVQTDDPGAHDRIVSTERVGYADGSRTIRLPEVVVARHGEVQ